MTTDYDINFKRNALQASSNPNFIIDNCGVHFFSSYFIIYRSFNPTQIHKSPCYIHLLNVILVLCCGDNDNIISLGNIKIETALLIYIFVCSFCVFFVTFFHVVLFLLCIVLVAQMRQAHIKLRHFHFEHEFNIIIKTEKAHRLHVRLWRELHDTVCTCRK